MIREHYCILILVEFGRKRKFYEKYEENKNPGADKKSCNGKTNKTTQRHKELKDVINLSKSW